MARYNFPMTTLTIDDVLHDLETFAAWVRSGETVMVAPSVKTEDLQPAFPDGRRPYGLAEGLFVVPDDFNDPLPDDIQAYFEGRGED